MKSWNSFGTFSLSVISLSVIPLSVIPLSVIPLSVIFVTIFSPFIGCGAKKVPLPSNIEVPIVSGQQDSTAATVGKTNLQLSLDTVTDKRPSPELIESGDVLVQPSGDLPGAVARSMTSVLTANGFAVADTAPLVLATELTQWKAETTGSKVNSEAAVAVKLYDPANTLIYSGKYQGSANLQKGGLSEADLREALQTSLHEAISQLCRDQKLINLISSF